MKAVTGFLRPLIFTAALVPGTFCTARADILEVDGNMQNGTIVSQDDKEVRFQEASGVEKVYPKSRVTYLEVEQPKPKEAGKDAGQEALREVRRKAGNVVKDVKRTVEETVGAGKKMTKKATDVIAKPVNRSAADKKAKDFGEAMKGYAENSKKLAQNQKKASIEQRKMKIFADRMRAGKTATEEDLEKELHGGKKSKFRSL